MKKPVSTEPDVNAVDEHVGRRVRSRRKLVRLSQAQLADELGLTFQQVQKYERGANRISASKLFMIARVLDVPVSYFFDGLINLDGAPTNLAGAQSIRLVDDLMGDDAAVLLMESFFKIRSSPVRRQLANLAAALAHDHGEHPAKPPEETQH